MTVVVVVVVVVMLAKMMSVVAMVLVTMTIRFASRWRRADLQNFSHVLGRTIYVESTFLPTILFAWMKRLCCTFRLLFPVH